MKSSGRWPLAKRVDARVSRAATGRCFFALLLVLASENCHANELARSRFSAHRLGTTIRLTVYAEDKLQATRAAQAALLEIDRLEAILSSYRDDSELVRLSNRSGSGQGIPVSNDLWQVLCAANRLSRKTQGAFDITVGPYSQLWKQARRERQLPTAEQLATAGNAVGYRHVQLDCADQRCRLTQPNMRLDLGGIAKGYIADRALAALQAAGCPIALVDAGGDLALGAAPPGRSGWRVGIAPLAADAPASQFLSLADAAVATSGDAWQSVTIDGVRYSHLLDPRTGIGLTQRSSVTVVASDCLTADSLASAVSVLGPQAGMRLIESICGAEMLLVEQRDGQAQRQSSTGLKALLDAD